MRHRKKSEKFSRSRAQRKALVKSLARALIINERIMTTTSKAKYLRGEVDKLITWGKKNSLFYRRLAYRILEDHNLVKRLFTVIAPRFKGINGGYTRVLKAKNRLGDGASLSLIELTRIEKKEKKNKLLKEPKAKVSGEEEATTEKDDKFLPKKAAKQAKPKKGIFSALRKFSKRKTMPSN